MLDHPTIPLDARSACQRYQEVQHRLVRAPAASKPRMPARVSNLMALREQIDVFVLDGFGVLNVGDTPVPGAVQAVTGLIDSGAKVLVLTNGATLPSERALSKYQNWGFDFAPQDVISSRSALAKYLRQAGQMRRWGFMATEQSDIESLADDPLLLSDDPAIYDEAQGFILLGSGQWNATYQHFLLTSLSRSPRPILVGNPDLVAPHADGFSLEPGYYAHQIADATAARPHFFGKPFQNVFDLVRERVTSLGKYRVDRIAMVGDTLHTDILGGSAAGWRTVLVSGHGLMRELDIESVCTSSAIYPDFIAATT